MIDKEARRCLEDSAVNFGAILLCLIEAGVISNEQFEEAMVRVRAETEAELRDAMD